MRSIYILSDDISLNERWEKLINYKVKTLYSHEELEELYDSILVVNMQICKDIEIELLKDFIKRNNYVLLLDNVPNLSVAQMYLKLGVKAYGNTLMTSSYLNSALEALDNGFVWLVPDITTQLVNGLVALGKKSDKEINDTILKDLTTQEKKIANFLKDGYTNSKISTTLNISINTVKTHVKNIYAKLSVNDRLSFSLLFK